MLWDSRNAAIDEWYLFDPAGIAWMDYKRRKEVLPCMRRQHAKRHGMTINQYRSGEITGGRFCTGLEGQMLKSPQGPRETEKLSQSGKSKIRRAIQNADCEFKCFMTVTFDPSMSDLTPDGVVDQKWGKEKFKRFINTIKVSCDRRAALLHDESRRIAYVWVCELQENGNIHFHVLLNQRLPIKWLTKVWDQAQNSIDVRSIYNQNHASCYLRKYIAKDNSTISGNRYGISQNLRETMKPIKMTIEEKKSVEQVQEIINSLTADIERNGGKVIDFGFYIPQPSRSVPYKKKGETKIRYTKGVNGQLGPFIIREVMDIIDPIPF